MYGKLSYELDIVGINRGLLRFNRLDIFMCARKFMARGIIEHRELFAGDLSRLLLKKLIAPNMTSECRSE